MALTDKDLDEIEAYYGPIGANSLPGHEAGFRAAQIMLLTGILRELRGDDSKEPPPPAKEKKK